MKIDDFNELRERAMAVVAARLIAERYTQTAMAEAAAQGKPLLAPKLAVGLMMALREVNKRTPVDFDMLEAMTPETMNETLNASLVHLAPDGTFTDGHVPKWLL